MSYSREGYFKRKYNKELNLWKDCLSEVYLYMSRNEETSLIAEKLSRKYQIRGKNNG